MARAVGGTFCAREGEPSWASICISDLSPLNTEPLPECVAEGGSRGPGAARHFDGPSPTLTEGPGGRGI